MKAVCRICDRAIAKNVGQMRMHYTMAHGRRPCGAAPACDVGGNQRLRTDFCVSIGRPLCTPRKSSLCLVSSTTFGSGGGEWAPQTKKSHTTCVTAVAADTKASHRCLCQCHGHACVALKERISALEAKVNELEKDTLLHPNPKAIRQHTFRAEAFAGN
jgi:hypothetical protein